MQPSEALPIRCHVALLAILLALALLQPAAAQGGLGSVELTPRPDARTAEPGAVATFRLEARNAHILEQNVAFLAMPPAGWTYNFTPANLTLAPGAWGNVTLEVFTPADAAVNATTPIPLEARGHGTDLVLGRGGVNVTLVAPARTPAPGPVETRPPAIELAVAPSAGEPGQTVEGRVTLRNVDARTLDATLAGEGPSGWNPRFLPGDAFHVLYPGAAARTVSVYASIPPGAAPNQTHDLTLTATVEGFRFPVAWRVAILPPAATAPPETGGQGGAAQPSATGAGGVPRVEPEPSTALDARVLDGLLQVAPGESVEGTLRLENVGTTTLKLRLAGRGPTDWASPVPERATLDLAPGEVQQVRFTLAAPADVIPSPTGRGQGSITATSENGLMRQAPFQVMVVHGDAVDLSTDPETTAAAAVAPGGESASLPFGTMGLAVAFGAVGAGAVAIANRPLREKLVWAGIGLYTRLARPDVLGHEDREKLYKLVEQTPGIHFHALQRDLGWNTGTLTYHLRVLEKHGFMVSRRDGLYRRFYLQGAAPRKEVFENAGPSGLRADVLEAIRNQHGMSQTDLSLALGANKQTVNYHVKALERQGLIRLEKKGRETFLYPAGAPSGGGMPGQAKA